MRAKLAVLLMAVVATTGLTPAAPADAATLPSACALNNALVRGWFGPPIEPVLGGGLLTGDVTVFGNIYCRNVSVVAKTNPYFQITPWQYGVDGACVPDPLAVGGTVGWCSFNTVQAYYPIGTIIYVYLQAVGVDDLGIPVVREGSCWLSYYYGEGTYQTCNPW